MNRELDGCYFRIVRDGVGQSVCFTDLTKGERDILLADKDTQFLKNLLCRREGQLPMLIVLCNTKLWMPCICPMMKTQSELLQKLSGSQKRNANFCKGENSNE